MSAWSRQPARRRVETWLWTGPVGHLVGGAADLLTALCRHGLQRRRRARAAAAGKAAPGGVADRAGRAGARRQAAAGLARRASPFRR